MDWVTLIFFAASYGALIASLRSGLVSAHLLAWAMMGAFCVINVLWLYDRLDLIVVVDLPIAMLSYAFAWGSEQPWRRAVVAAFFSRLMLHVLVSLGTIAPVIYAHTCNVAFLAALIAVSWNGGISDVAGWADRLCRLCVGMAKGSPSLVSRLRP